MNNQMTRRSFLSLTAAAALSLTACGGSSDEKTPETQGEPASVSVEKTPETTPIDLTIKESGYYVDEQYGNAHYAVIIENQNLQHAAYGIEMVITCKDSSGNIIGSEPAYLWWLYNDGVSALCGQTTTAGVATVEFQLTNSSDQWVEDDRTQARYDGAFYAQNINESSYDMPDYKETLVLGEIVNGMTNDFDNPAANVVLRDDSGAIVGGANGFISSGLTAGSTQSFEVNFNSEAPAHSKVEVYADCGMPKA